MPNMTLLIEAPSGYEPERRYIVDVVLADRLGLDWRLELGERSDVRITLDGDAQHRSLLMPDALFATPADAWLAPSSLPSEPLAWRVVPELAGGALSPGQRLPVLYGASTANDALARSEPGAMELGVDILGSCFFMLARYEERVTPTRDEHGRFPATASIAHRAGFLGLAIVDAYVELLWAALRRLWPRLERRPEQYGVALTHDVDDPLASLGRSSRERVRQLGADVLVRRDLGLVARRLRSWGGIRRRGYRLDPYNTFDFLMDVSERHGLTSAFYFLAVDEIASAHDPPYTLEHPWVRSLMRRIHGRGHEIGFHAGFSTYRDARLTQAEFARLRQVAEHNGIRQEVWGGRQHYLRWENPSTWSNWELAGLDYDSTVAYADHVGFRAGTCHAFRAFQLLERRPLQLYERPFQVMDGTLFGYMGLSPEAAMQAALDVARECRRYAGTFVLLWHNNVLLTARQRRWYEQLVSAVSVPP
jgi:hypothetical protein